jgi:PAS domain S-box-containing protein
LLHLSNDETGPAACSAEANQPGTGRALEEARGALRDSERRLRLLIDSVSEYAIVTLDRVGRVLGWNAGATRIFRCQEADIVGRHFSAFYSTDDIAQGKPVRDLEIAAAEGSVREEGMRLRADRTSFWAELVLTALRDQHGRPEGFAMVIHDISARKRAEAERDELLAREQLARAAAEAASRAKNEFISTLSHELRTPLTAILGWTRMLRTRHGDPTFIARAVEVIERNTKAQANLVEELLDISRIEQGKLQLSVRSVEVQPLLTAALDTVRPAADGKEITIIKQVDPSVHTLTGDPDRLQQVLCNLLANAIKFTPARGRVELRLSAIEEHIEISVTDTGPGIAPEFLPYVFDRFRQADSSATRHAGGLGIGLAIVRHLVEMHGGTVEAQSEGLGTGSRFVIRLPAPIGAGDGVGPEPARPAGGGGAGAAMRGIRIVLVEDDADSRELLAQVLTQAGADVRPCASTREAMAVLAGQLTWTPDVLVSDIGLPAEDGYDLISKVRARPDDLGRLPAVALTGFAGPRDRARILGAGFQLHVPKPVDPDELAAAIASVARAPVR